MPGTVLTMQSLTAIAILVVVLNVVVNQRGFMKRFDRHGHSRNRVGHVRSGITDCECSTAAGRVPGCQRDERTESLAALAEPVVGDVFREGHGRFSP